MMATQLSGRVSVFVHKAAQAAVIARRYVADAKASRFHLNEETL